jgi:hypothetical protein
MSVEQKPVRARAPKAKKQQAAAPAQPAPPPEPVPELPQNGNSNGNGVDHKDDEEASRRQISQVLGLEFAPSRVRKLIDKKGVNSSYGSAIEELTAAIAAKTPFEQLSEKTRTVAAETAKEHYDAELKKYNTKYTSLMKSDAAAAAKLAKPAQAATLQEYVDALSSARCRFSQDTAIALTAALEFVAKQLIRAALIECDNNAPTMIKPASLFTPSMQEQPYYCLIRGLPVVKKTIADLKKPPENFAEAPAAPAVQEVKDAVPAATKKAVAQEGFKFYVLNIFRSMKAELAAEKGKPAFNDYRVSEQVKVICSDIVTQLGLRVARHVEMFIEQTGGKTINCEIIDYVFKVWMTDAEVDYEPMKKFIDDVLAKFKKMQLEQKTRQEENKKLKAAEAAKAS